MLNFWVRIQRLLFDYPVVKKKTRYYVFDKFEDYLSENYQFPFHNFNSAKKYAKKFTIKENQEYAVVDENGEMIIYFVPQKRMKRFW